ncbi:MAG: choice-of-anchor tandem repeat GloVer-containing protein [Bryobacteraceae bacterium]|jgi:uncharacterized repeat protein (TIGR03803 family)
MKTTTVFFLATACISQAQTLVNFNGSNGANPLGSFIRGTDGNFYGTTYLGGTSSNCNGGGCGIVFEMTPDGSLTVLHSFDGLDGYQPFGLIQGADGNLYGTTGYGGVSACGEYCGYGTAFQITPAGAFTTLHIFAGNDGSQPFSPPTEGKDGNFYGTTFVGGDYGSGTVYKMSPSGTVTSLYSFCSSGKSCPGGANPSAALVRARNGKFYGTTNDGGLNGYGTIFEITADGEQATLHRFTLSDGSLPAGGLMQATNGLLYGTTVSGGANNYGTIFSITPGGRLTTMHSFVGTDGSQPQAVLLETSTGELFGAARSGGTQNEGTLFKVSSDGEVTVLNCFDGAEGANPSSLVQDPASGRIYTTTFSGGSNGYGTIYEWLSLVSNSAETASAGIESKELTGNPDPKFQTALGGRVTTLPAPGS